MGLETNMADVVIIIFWSQYVQSEYFRELIFLGSNYESERKAWAESLRLRKRCLGDVRGCAVVLCGEGQPSLKKGNTMEHKKIKRQRCG